MALKLLNPGLRPLGMFDLADADAGTLEGGEYVQLEAAGGTEGYAADVGDPGPFSGAGTVTFSVNSRTAGSLGGLADEGTDEYGTLFGSLIGQNVGQATQVSGAVVLGPSTDRASGKVTVWAVPGLYGVSGAAADDAVAPLNAMALNLPVHADANGLLTSNTGLGDQVAISVGAMTDTSLVSTTASAAGEPSSAEYIAVFYTGNAQA